MWALLSEVCLIDGNSKEETTANYLTKSAYQIVCFKNRRFFKNYRRLIKK